MKCLVDKFKEELSAEENLYIESGNIFIRDRYWSPVDILGMASNGGGVNNVFEEVFNDWFEERVEIKKGQADDILDKYDQQDRFLRLTEVYKAGSLMPFVGAGLSISTGYPGWTKFLSQKWKLIDRPESELLALLENGQYEEAAEQLANGLGAGFSEEIDNAFGCSREPIVGPVGILPYLFGAGVITTNYDNTLERCYRNADMQFHEKLSGTESQEISRWLTLNERILLMLHGKSFSGRGRILTVSEYDQHYGDDNTLNSTIEAICSCRNLLFIGCSLTVDRTVATIKEFVSRKGHDNLPKHYAFLEDPGESNRNARQRVLSDCHIYPIWYPVDEHDESIEAFFMKLYASAT